MRIIAFRYDKISGEKFKIPEGIETVNIQNNFALDKVEKQNSKDSNSSPNSNQDTIFSFTFTYEISYNDIAKLEFKGRIFTSTDKKEAKELEKKGADAITTEMRTDLLNFILLRTHVESLRMEEIFNLPFHTPAQQVKFGQEEGLPLDSIK